MTGGTGPDPEGRDRSLDTARTDIEALRRAPGGIGDPTGSDLVRATGRTSRTRGRADVRPSAPPSRRRAPPP